MLGLHPCIQEQVPQSCNITTLNFEKAPLQCYLGNVIPCCTWVSVSPPAPAATYHSVSNDMCVMQQYSHIPTIAMTPLMLNGDMIMFPGSSFSCWYSLPPNTWEGSKSHVNTRVSQMCFHWTNIIAAGGKLQFVKCWCELLPCSLWQRQPLGQLLWSCPTWFDCWLAEKKEQATNSGKEDIHWVKHKPWDGNRTNKIAIMPF